MKFTKLTRSSFLSFSSYAVVNRSVDGAAAVCYLSGLVVPAAAEHVVGTCICAQAQQGQPSALALLRDSRVPATEVSRHSLLVTVSLHLQLDGAQVRIRERIKKADLRNLRTTVGAPQARPASSKPGPVTTPGRKRKSPY